MRERPHTLPRAQGRAGCREESPAIAFFDPARPSYLANPYPALARLRREAPVFFDRGLDAWLITRHADCVEVLRDHDRFASDTARASGRLGAHVRAQRQASPLGDRPLFGQADPPDHTRLRAIVNRAFTPRVVADHRDVIAAEVDRLVATITPGEPFDFARQIAEALPVLVIGDLLGLDDTHRLAVRARAGALMRALTDDRATAAERADALSAREWLRAFLDAFARDHRDDRRRSLIAMLHEAEAAGGRLTRDELLAFVVFLYTAGSGPTAGLLGNGMAALLDHPDQLARLRAEPACIADATDELLRYDSPTQVLARVAVADTTLAGRRIRAGESVLAMVGAANRDPEAFADPDRLDVTRQRASRHLSYGYGAHFCLGAPLARLEAELLLHALFARFDSLEAVPGGFAPGGTFMLRAPRTLAMVAR